MNKKQIELLQLAAQHFKVLENEEVSISTPDCAFFYLSEWEKLRKRFGKHNLKLIAKEDVSEY